MVSLVVLMMMMIRNQVILLIVVLESSVRFSIGVSYMVRIF